VGKYIKLPDAYKSLIQALTHAALYHQSFVNLVWIDAEDLSQQELLETVDGIIVPGGFGHRGLEGKLAAITFARIHQVPFLGICLGMQLAIIEAARGHLGLDDASSTEFGKTTNPVVGLLTEWEDHEVLQVRTIDAPYGGTMRLGAYPCKIKKGTLASSIYDDDLINERHRHRYEVNSSYKEALEKYDLIFSGLSPDGRLLEIVEYKNHPWFLATQFHPELKSRPFNPHPIFKSFIKACIKT
jgi:CTP synthase